MFWRIKQTSSYPLSKEMEDKSQQNKWRMKVRGWLTQGAGMVNTVSPAKQLLECCACDRGHMFSRHM